MNAPALKNWTSYAVDQLLNLLYPNLCIYCESRTHSSSELFCLDCQYQVHPTGMYYLKENEFTSHFKGRVNLAQGAALYYYVKGGRLQKAMELLKYKDKPEIGYRLGKFFGSILKSIPSYTFIDLIIPVPLHPRRKILRGYNQSALIARGLSEQLQIHVYENLLIRNKETNTQTEKNRMERSLNMQKVFALLNPEKINGKHILLVDDILTTGATLEACARLIQNQTSAQISMVTIGMAT